MSERIVVVTGGNKGLVFETARRSKSGGYRVYVGVCQPERRADAALRLDVEWLQLDVTNELSVRSASASCVSEKGGSTF
jgi:NAD(P)-dependent dehydrogenase (short-subunit alcohol dehydrogenase family)